MRSRIRKVTNSGSAMNNTLNTLQDHADSVADMRDEIDGVINGNVPNAPNNQTIQQLNGLSDDIDNFFGQLASPETSFYGWGLTAAQAADEMQQALNNSNGTAFGNSVQGYVN